MDEHPSQPSATGPLSAVAEAALWRLFGQASQSFHVMDREGRVLHGNDRFREYLGLPGDPPAPLGFQRLRHDLAPAQAEAWFQEAFDRTGDRHELATWLREDGRELPVRLLVAGLETEAGARVFIWARDRSEEQFLTNRLVEGASLQRHLADGIYALSLVGTRPEAYRVLMGRASAILPGPHWFVGRLEPGEGCRLLKPLAWMPSLQARFGDSVGSLGIPILDSGFAREVYDQRRVCFVEDARATPGMVSPALVETYGFRSLLGVPLVFEGELLGVLFGVGFQGDPPVVPRETQFSMIQSLARLAALALERIEAEARLAAAAALARNLALAVKDLAGALDEETLVALLFAHASRLVPLPEWWFNRYDPVGRTSITTHWTPGIEAYGSPEDIQRPVAIEASLMLLDMHREHRSFLVPRCEEHPDFPDMDQWPFRTFVGLPLSHEGAVVGTLSGGSFGAQGHVRVSEDQFKALESLAETAGLVLNRLRSRRALEAEEARFRLLFERSPDPTLLFSDGILVDANAAAAALIGLDRQTMPGLPVRFLLPDRQPDGTPSQAGFEDRVAQALMGQADSFEWSLRIAGGREAVCLVTFTRLDHGDRPLVHATVRDLTLQRRMEADRSALERQLFQAQKMESLGVLAGGIAHDFNNLLMGVLGHAGLALEQLNPLHPARRNLEAIQKAGHRAADLTRQMLAYSGRGQFVVRDLDLTLQVQEMVHLLEVSIPKTVVLNLDLRTGLPAVSADASQVQQVIMNLVINASEAIGEISGAITLATGAQWLDEAAMGRMLVGQNAPSGTYVYLEVTDTGCGMDEETLTRIFEPFFTTKFTGRGLGLSAIMGIVRGHGGALRVYSEVGRGTTFKVLFPARPGAVAPAAKPETDGAWSGTGIILVVDDDETVRAVARQALELKGFQVMEAADGRQAVAQVQEHGSAIGLVLLDMTMPHMGGEAAFREMRYLQPDLRVILSSGYNEVEAMGRFLGKGLRGFIQKPYGPRDLLAKIQEVLES